MVVVVGIRQSTVGFRAGFGLHSIRGCVNEGEIAATLCGLTIGFDRPLVLDPQLSSCVITQSPIDIRSKSNRSIRIAGQLNFLPDGLYEKRQVRLLIGAASLCDGDFDAVNLRERI